MSDIFKRKELVVMKRKRVESVLENRIVAHIDLDCFYVQVERSINPFLKGKAVGVAQYNPFGDLKSYSAEDNRIVNSGSLIAVSYEARAKGVKRNMRGAEAKKVCPEMLLVQVPTSHGKADLTIYRDASARILTVLCSKFPACIVERSSIDEVYLDVTAEAAKWLEQADSEQFLSDAIQTLLAIPSMIAGDDTAEVLMSRRQISKGHSGTEMLAASYSNVQPSNIANNDPSEAVPVLVSSWFARPASKWSTKDKLMLCGALVVNQLRRAVFDELGFTCSAGIANNKMLAKLSSAMHKPNKQTLAPACVIPGLMKDLPYSRIQGLGGKLGTAIETLYGEKVRTMGQILATPRQEWARHFGEETATWLHNVARGIDLEPVLNRSLPISIGCSKSFRSTMMLTPAMILDGSVLHWITELAHELQERVTADTKANSRIPRNLHCGASVKILPNGESNSSSSDITGNNNNNSSSVAIPTSSNAKNDISGTIDPDDVVANWHEQAGFSLSKICPMQSLNGNTALMARTAFQMLVRTILEHPKFTSVYGSNISVPQLGAIVPNKAAGNGNTGNNGNNSISNTGNNGSNNSNGSSACSGNSSNGNITSPSKPATSTSTSTSTLPAGWAITGISLGATNFQTIESGASSIRSYFGTTARSENTAEPALSVSGAAPIDPVNSVSNINSSNGNGSSSESEEQDTKSVTKPSGGIRDLFARQSATQTTKEATSGEPSITAPATQHAGKVEPVVSASLSIRDLLLRQAPRISHTIATDNTTNIMAPAGATADLAYDLTVSDNNKAHNTSSTTTTVTTTTTTANNDIRHWVSRRGPPLDTLVTSPSISANTISSANTKRSDADTQVVDEAELVDHSEEEEKEFLEGGDVIIEEISSQSQSFSQGPPCVTDLTTSSYVVTASCSNITNSQVNTTSAATGSTGATCPVSTQHNYQPRSMGDIDSAVFLTLPSEIQREIELTMKLRAHTQLNRPVQDRNTQKISNTANLFNTNSSANTGTTCQAILVSTSRTNLVEKTELKHQPDSMMDVDSAVFLSLPADIQREIELTMKLRQQRRNSGASTHIHRPSKGKKQ